MTDTEKALQEPEKSYRIQSILNQLLSLSLQDIPLVDLLDQALDRILEAPFMPLKPKGGIFLVKGDAEELTLKVSRNLPPTLLGMCGKVPFGTCLCGRAAAEGRIVFAAAVDERHDHRYEGIVPHGHYNVPILSRAIEGKVLGVIVLYVAAEHARDSREEEFLQSVANTLAGVIERRQAEERVRDSEARYRRLIDLSPVGIAIHTDGKVAFANPAAAGILGGTPDQLIGKPVADIVHPDFREQVGARINAMMSDGAPVSMIDEKFIGVDGRVVDVEVVALPLTYNAKPSVMVMLQDISRRKRLEADRVRAKALSDALNSIDTAIGSTLDFDEIMRRVAVESAAALAVETAVILIKEDDRWVARYMHGLRAEYTGRRFAKKDVGASELAAGTGKPVVINDAFRDARVNRRIMKQFDIRSMLVVPLTVKDEVIGSLVFQHHSAAVPFTEDQIDFAAKLSQSVSLAIENARLYSEQRTIADTLQHALLTIPERLQGLELGHLYRSATMEKAEVGGDFFDAFELAGGNACFVIGDVSGKGLEAATLTSLIKNTIKAYAYIDESPAAILEKTNELVMASTPPHIFATVFFAVLDIGSGLLTYCGAGHPPGLVRGGGASGIRFLTTDSPAVGLLSGLDFNDRTELLSPGEILFLYTDGLTDARRGKEFFGEDRLVAFVSNLTSPSAAAAPAALIKEIEKFTGGLFADDIAMLTASIK